MSADRHETTLSEPAALPEITGVTPPLPLHPLRFHPLSPQQILESPGILHEPRMFQPRPRQRGPRCGVWHAPGTL